MYTNAHRLPAIWIGLVVMYSAGTYAAEPGLVGHWKLQGDCRDYSGNGNDGVNHGVELNSGGFDGVHAYIEVPTSKSLKLGTGDFTICARVYTEKQLDDIVGDVIDIYDPAARRGITLSINRVPAGFNHKARIATFILASTTPKRATGKTVAGQARRVTTLVSR